LFSKEFLKELTTYMIFMFVEPVL